MRIAGVSFDSPAWLWMLSLMPVLAVFLGLALRARRRALVRLLGDTAREQLTEMAGRNRRAAEAALAVITAALVVTALAGPRWGVVPRRMERTGVDVAIVLDTSRSMLAEDIVPSRMDRALREIRGLLDVAAGSRVAIVSFAGRARVLCPFTLDHDTVALFLDDVDPGSDHAGGSDLAAGLQAASDAFDASSGAGRAVVILSDGEDQTGGASVTTVAAALAARGVRVHAIGLGTPDGAKIPVTDDHGKTRFFRDSKGNEVVSRGNPTLLAQAAAAGGGEFLDASTAAFPMDELWRKRISVLAKGGTGAEDVQSLESRFQWFLGAAIATASLWWLVPLGFAVRKRRETRVRGLAWTRGAAAMLAASAVALAPSAVQAGSADDGIEGDALYRKGEFPAAAAAYEASARSRPSEQAAHNLGNARFRAGQFGAAAKSWADAEKMTTSPDARRDALFNRGNAFLQQAETDPAMAVDMLQESIRSFDTALSLDPTDRDARHNRAIAIARWVEAQKQAQKGGKGAPGEKGGKEDPPDKPEAKDPQDGGKQDGDPTKGGEKQERQGGEKGQGTPEASPNAEPTPGDEDAMGQAEVERIDRLLEEQERAQRRLEQVKARMHKKEGEKNW